MNAYLNYLIEANLSLVVLLMAYVVLLHKETDFNKKRLFMLFGIVASILFPFLHLQNGNMQSIPSISTIVSAYWLPEVIITGEQTGQSLPVITLSDIWNYLQWTYVIILLFFLARFLVQLASLIRTIAKSKGYTWHGFRVVESNEVHQTFSFFNFIFIGQAHSLSADDKNKIVQHEAVHAKQLHSIDIVLLNVLSIFFWFNPLIKTYKKIFVQLHEFEADARAVDNTEVDEYCNLLAKVALQSANYPLANHFNQSLTLKRIEMMRTLKHKIKPWKIITLSAVILCLFFVVACQDQLADATDIAKNSSVALDIPANVQKQFDEIQHSNPTGKYVLIEVNEDRTAKLDAMKPVLEEYDKKGGDEISSVHVIKEADRRFIVIGERSVEEIGRFSVSDDVYTIVEESASPVNGIESIGPFLQQNLNYPKESRKAGKEGTVYVQFVVNTDGSLSDFTIINGVDKLMDEEAVRVASLFPNWNPAKQSGKAVRQRFVLPIRFTLDGETSSSSSSVVEIREVKSQFKIDFTVTEKADKKIVTGKIKNQTGEAVAGANIVNVGSTTGTVSDTNGNFTISVPKTHGQLAVSFIGYEMMSMVY